MADERELQELGKLLFGACEVYDCTRVLRGIPHRLSFTTDIDNFILAFSDDPAERLKEMTWLDEVRPKDEKIIGYFQELSELYDVLQEMDVEIPQTIRLMKERRQAPERMRAMFADLTDDFYHFFDLFGHWLLNESQKNETFEKRREKLEETLTAIRDYIER